MRHVSDIRSQRPLTSRRAITVELPEFLIRALECRVEEANATSRTDDDAVTLEHLVELELAESLSIADVALLEQHVPGISAAVSQWLSDID